MTFLSIILFNMFSSIIEKAPAIDWAARRQAALEALQQAMDKEHINVGRYTKKVIADCLIAELDKFCEKKNHDGMKYIEENIKCFAVSGRICL